jgi:hypothetical protein
MSIIGAEAGKVQSPSLNFTIEAISTQIEPAWIQDALKQSGKESKRVRKLPSDLVIQLLVAMGLKPQASIMNVLRDLSVGFQGKLQKIRRKLPTSSSITKARDRLGIEPVKRLFERQGSELARRHEAQQEYKGMPLVGFDGSSLKTPDSSVNRKTFGAPKSGRGRSAFPMMRILTLVAVATHITTAAVMGPWAVGEMTMAMELLSWIDPGSLVLMDRGFVSYFLWVRLLDKPCHFLTRAKRNQNFRRRKKLGEGDWLVELRVPAPLKRKHPELPETMTLRLIRYRIPGFQTSWLITSLLDSGRYPAEELVSLYHARWELELAYSELKTRLRPSGEPLRSESPDRVRQEVYGLLIAHNAVRGLMAEAAARSGIPALRLSFTDSLQRIRTAMIRMADAHTGLLLDLYNDLLRDISTYRLPPRKIRHNPRVIKVKMSKWPLKRKSA